MLMRLPLPPADAGAAAGCDATRMRLAYKYLELNQELPVLPTTAPATPPPAKPAKQYSRVTQRSHRGKRHDGAAAALAVVETPLDLDAQRRKKQREAMARFRAKKKVGFYSLFSLFYVSQALSLIA